MVNLNKKFNIRNIWYWFIKLDLKIVIIALLGIIVLLQQCDFNLKDKQHDFIKIKGEKYEIIEETIDTVYDTKTLIEYKPGEVIYKDSIVYVDTPVNIDTMKIINEFYKKQIYKDTLILEHKLGNVNIVDTITMNKIVGRTWTSNINEKMINSRLIVKEPEKLKLYGGVYSQFNKSDLFKSIGGGLVLKTKNDNLYQLNVGVMNEFNKDLTPYIGAGIYWKIKF